MESYMNLFQLALATFLLTLTLSSNTQAQEWKRIPCDQVKFKTSIPFQKCDYQLDGHREIWAAAFHDEISSAFVGVYTHKNGMNLRNGTGYATGAEAYRVFFDKYPAPSDLIQRGKWLSFPATVLAAQSKRKMNCLQFFKPGPVARAGYLWTAIAALCVSNGEVPESAADLVLESLQVSIK